MSSNTSRRPPPLRTGSNRPEKLAELVNMARRTADTRLQGYREQSLRLHPWVCARCGREFQQDNLIELTVHHKDHNHDNNPPDGRNWENLCIYCHDNEHARYVDHLAAGKPALTPDAPTTTSTHQPFAELQALLAKRFSGSS